MIAQTKGQIDTDYLPQGSEIYLIPRFRGGGCPPPRQMTMAAGGKINQRIVRDKFDQNWEHDRTTVFNVQILNSAVYQAVTGTAPPENPISVRMYRRHGFPFFQMYEEPSGISGDFSMVKSVAHINGDKEDVVTSRVVEIEDTAKKQPVGLILNPDGPLREFRTVADLAKEYSGYHVVDF